MEDERFFRFSYLHFVFMSLLVDQIGSVPLIGLCFQSSAATHVYLLINYIDAGSCTAYKFKDYPSAALKQ